MDHSYYLSRALLYARDGADAVKSFVDAAVKRQTNFTPTTEAPSPSVALDFNHPAEYNWWDSKLEALGPHFSITHSNTSDLHDAAAVVAGSKPAAWLSTPFLKYHPVGRELSRRLVDAGHEVWHLPDDSSVVGKKENVAALAAAAANPATDHAAIGTALGYPQSAVQDYLTRNSKLCGTES